MKLNGKIRLFLMVTFCNMFLTGVCLSAAGQRGMPGGWENGGAETVNSVPAADAAERAGLISPDSGMEPTADSEKLMALTFDDGPHKVHTKRLLDGLKERGVKASFFLVGENIPGNEELVRQMAEDGHFIGIHCYSHVDLTKKTTEDSCRDILKTAELIEDITGRRPEYIRPPYGNWSEELEECVGMTTVFWDIDTLDWQMQNSAKILSHIVKQAGKHHVVLLHDVFSSSVNAALAAVDTLANQGYTFVTVDDLVID